MAEIEGFSYRNDEDGNPRSVVLDLDECGELWEDFYDGMMAARCKSTITWEELKAEMYAEMEAEIEREGEKYV